MLTCSGNYSFTKITPYRDNIIMSLPNILFGTLLAILFGVIYHLIRGGNYKKMILYILLSIVGFWVGNLISFFLNWNIRKIGQLDILLGTIGSRFLMALDYIARTFLNPDSNYSEGKYAKRVRVSLCLPLT